MKRSISILLFLLWVQSVATAQNFVPNGSFEQYSGCPDQSQVDTALFWGTPSLGTPDFFHQCAIWWAASVPNNAQGNQPAQNGIGYYGIYLFDQQVNNVREYIEVELTSSLVTGTCYQLELYVSASDYVDFTTDALGIFFSDTLITGIQNINNLPYIPQINNTTGVFDTLNWRLVSGNYTASGGENYMIIGNFKTDANTFVQHINNNNFLTAYVYIDNVSLSICTAVNDVNDSKTKYQNYPNPFTYYTIIPVPQGYAEQQIIITDISGRQVKIISVGNETRLKISGNDLNSGTYFYRFTKGDLNNNYKMLLIK